MKFGLPELQEIWNKIPATLQTKSCIAGGAVRDALIGRMPDDIDIFCFGGGIDSWEYSLKFDSGRLMRFEGYGTDDDDVQYLETSLGKHTLQIIDATMFGNSLEDLCSNFDWNICCFAYDNDGLHCYEDPNVLWPGGTLRVRNGAFVRPKRAFLRGKEFAKRYQLSLPYSELRKIAAHTLAEKRRIIDQQKEWKFQSCIKDTSDFFEELAATM